MVVFEVVSKMGKRTRLTEVQWAHISSKHPELENQIDNMIVTLQEPDHVYHSPIARLVQSFGDTKTDYFAIKKINAPMIIIGTPIIAPTKLRLSRIPITININPIAFNAPISFPFKIGAISYI